MNDFAVETGRNGFQSDPNDWTPCFKRGEKKDFKFNKIGCVD